MDTMLCFIPAVNSVLNVVCIVAIIYVTVFVKRIDERMGKRCMPARAESPNGDEP